MCLVGVTSPTLPEPKAREEFKKQLLSLFGDVDEESFALCHDQGEGSCCRVEMRETPFTLVVL